MAAIHKDQRHSDDEVYRTLAERSISVPGGCRLWLGSRLKRHGYGMIRHRTKWTRTHKAMYELTYGDVPAGVHVLHTCDVPNCIQPAHLYLGNNAQNIQDKCERDRSGKKLNISLARKIKLMLASGLSQSEIARQFGLNPGSVSKIATGRRWKHVVLSERSA